VTCTKIIVGDTCIYLRTLSDGIPKDIHGPMAALVPAFDEAECEVVLTMIPALLASNCIEIACVGVLAEKLHDQIDSLVEELRRSDVITTFHSDVMEATEYFVFAAGASAPTLLAFVGGHSDIVDALSRADSDP
jgi:hypothetical protein